VHRHFGGARVIGTAGEGNFDVVTRFGGVPVTCGGGLEQRVREAAPEGVVAALDCVGTDEAVDVSLALVADRDRIVTIAAAERAKAEGFTAIAGQQGLSRLRASRPGAVGRRGAARGPHRPDLPSGRRASCTRP